jgi:hypothetical protein
MSDQDFFPDSTLELIIRATGGELVEYRGQECHFHVETPTAEQLLAASIEVRGIAKMLIGPTGAFPNLEENTLITVKGDDYIVADWRHPEDGGVIYIFLKRNTTRQ